MRLRILLPARVVLDEDVAKIVAEAENGWFCIRPRHIDFVAALVPSILLYTGDNGIERFVAADEGLLVKCADEVVVSTNHAVQGDSLATLKQLVVDRFVRRDEREQSARKALARLEAGIVRRFIELRERGGL